MDNLSIFSLILSSGIVVQAVMLVLVLMSVYSWTIIMSKKKTLMNSSKNIKVFNRKFYNDFNPKAYYQSIVNNSDNTSIQQIFTTGYKEFTQQKTDTDTQTNKIANSERAYRAMNTFSNQQLDDLNKDLSVLAMIASSSPYIGLFGTVWGIMHSFIGLASVKQATIAIVAPGIAEALIATAFGLFAAIPATIAYNRLSTQVGEINNKYTTFVEKMFVVFQR